MSWTGTLNYDNKTPNLTSLLPSAADVIMQFAKTARPPEGEVGSNLIDFLLNFKFLMYQFCS